MQSSFDQEILRYRIYLEESFHDTTNSVKHWNIEDLVIDLIVDVPFDNHPKNFWRNADLVQVDFVFKADLTMTSPKILIRQNDLVPAPE